MDERVLFLVVVVVYVLGFSCFRLGCLDKPDYLAVTAESMYNARLCSANKIIRTELFPGRSQRNRLPT